MSVAFRNIQYRKHVQSHENGTSTLGFVDLTVVLEKTEVHLQDGVVRLKSDGTLALTAPARRYRNREDQPRSRSSWKFDDVTYRRIVNVLESMPAVEDARMEASEKSEDCVADIPLDDVPF